VLAEEGFRALGVNALARAAGCDKVLIYRYFGGLGGLLAAYAEAGDLWWSVDEIIGDDLPPPADDTLEAWCALALARQVAALRRRPVTIQLLAWELIEPNELTSALTKIREERHRALLGRLRAITGLGQAHVRLLAVHALLAAAATYLVLRARTVDQWLGVDFEGDEGWNRLDTVAGGIVRAVLREDAA
jgi:AcrR family transcriptional regulator